MTVEWPLKVYVGAVCLVAVALATMVTMDTPAVALLPVIVFALLDFVTENFSLELPMGGSVSLSFAIAYAALLHSGPLAAVVAVLAGSTNVQDIRSKKPVIFQVYNAAQLVIAAALSGLVFTQLGGEPLAWQWTPIWSRLLPAIAGAVTFFATNVALVSVFVALLRGRRVLEVFNEQHFLSYTMSLLVLVLLGFVLAELMHSPGWWSLPLLAAPFVVARQTFRVYQELARAYKATVGSLVSALEAKDPYTSGHSQRVAMLSRRIADAMGMLAQKAERVEIAALLHDIGKIGIAAETLSKPAELDEQEYAKIRLHPSTGADLLSGVEFLDDVVPIVRAHHERPDGQGYPAGLELPAIPLESRILAVADCLDAMTSTRPYRDALPWGAALQELGRVSGTQLDPRIVEAVLADPQLASGLQEGLS